MALNISPGGERSNDVGRSDGLTAGRSEVPPGVDDGIRDFREAHRTPEDCCESRSPVERRRLRGIEQDRSMLQEGIAAPNLCGTHELAPVHENLAAHRGREAGRWTVGRSDGLTVCQNSFHTQGPQRPGESLVNLAVGVAQRSEDVDRRRHCVRHFMLVPHGLATGGSMYHRHAVEDGRLIAADRECWRIPPVQSEPRTAETNCVVQQRYVGCHVLDARTSLIIDNQLPQAVRPSDRPTVRQWRRLPPADMYTPGSGRRTRHRSG